MPDGFEKFSSTSDSEAEPKRERLEHMESYPDEEDLSHSVESSEGKAHENLQQIQSSLNDLRKQFGKLEEWKREIDDRLSQDMKEYMDQPVEILAAKVQQEHERLDQLDQLCEKKKESFSLKKFIVDDYGGTEEAPEMLDVEMQNVDDIVELAKRKQIINERFQNLYKQAQYSEQILKKLEQVVQKRRLQEKDAESLEEIESRIDELRTQKRNIRSEIRDIKNDKSVLESASFGLYQDEDRINKLAEKEEKLTEIIAEIDELLLISHKKVKPAGCEEPIRVTPSGYDMPDIDTVKEVFFENTEEVVNDKIKGFLEDKINQLPDIDTLDDASERFSHEEVEQIKDDWLRHVINRNLLKHADESDRVTGRKETFCEKLKDELKNYLASEKNEIRTSGLSSFERGQILKRKDKLKETLLDNHSEVLSKFGVDDVEDSLKGLVESVDDVKIMKRSFDQQVQSAIQLMPLIEHLQTANSYHDYANKFGLDLKPEENFDDSAMRWMMKSELFSRHEEYPPATGRGDGAAKLLTKTAGRFPKEVWSRISDTQALQEMADKQGVDWQILKKGIENGTFRDLVLNKDPSRYKYEQIIDMESTEMTPYAVLESWQHLEKLSEHPDLEDDDVPSEKINSLRERLSNVDLSNFSDRQQEFIRRFAESKDNTDFIQQLHDEGGRENLRKVLIDLYQSSDEAESEYAVQLLERLPHSPALLPDFFAAKVKGDTESTEQRGVYSGMKTPPNLALSETEKRDEKLKGLVLEKVRTADTPHAVVWFMQHAREQAQKDKQALKNFVYGLEKNINDLSLEQRNDALGILLSNAGRVIQSEMMRSSSDLKNVIKKLEPEQAKFFANNLLQNALTTQVRDFDYVLRFAGLYDDLLNSDTDQQLVQEINKNPAQALGVDLDDASATRASKGLTNFLHALNDESTGELVNQTLQSAMNTHAMSESMFMFAYRNLDHLKNQTVEKLFKSLANNPNLIIANRLGQEFSGLVDSHQDLEVKERAHWRVFEAYLRGKPKQLRQLVADDDFVLSEDKKRVMDVMEDIWGSPSSTVKNLGFELAEQIVRSVELGSDAFNQLHREYKKIEKIFVENNIPFVGKQYKVFEALYPDSRIEDNISSTSSPVLQNLSNDKRRYVVFRDLLRGSFDSFNRDLYQYLSVMEEGKHVLEKFESGRELSDRGQDELKNFLRKIDTMVENIRSAEGFKDLDFDNLSIEENVQAIRDNFQVDEGKTIIEEFTETFLQRAGFNSLGEAVDHYQNIRERVTNRNKESLDREGVQLSEGDLVKRVSLDHFHKQMNRGFSAPEFVGAQTQEAKDVAESGDATPFDTDLRRLQDETSIPEEIKSSTFGDINIFIRDRGQFHETGDDEGNASYQFDKPELFQTGTNRWGIRTNFASSQIDAIGVTEQLSRDTERIEKLKFVIARQGFFIPIMDDQGEVLFDREDYNEYREIFAGVDDYFGGSIEISDSWKNSSLSEHISEYEQNSESLEAIDACRQPLGSDIETAIEEVGIPVADEGLRNSLVGAEIIDTGSTGRGAALDISEGVDFDFVVKLNDNDFEKHEQVAERIEENYPLDRNYWQGPNNEMHQFRFLDFEQEETGHEVSLDIGFVKKSDRQVVDAQDALRQKYESIGDEYGREARLDVLTGVRFAKKQLKEANCYKKGGKEGGLGGIGVENWILQNKGDVYKAFQTFYNTAYQDGELIPFPEFKEEYKIFSAGVNVRGNDFAENFVSDNMRAGGYEGMAELARELIEESENTNVEDT